MTISKGDKIPASTVLRMGSKGPEEIAIADYAGDRKVVVFGLPGAFTRTCTSAHVPSFIRTFEDFAAKGVDEIICVAVNDPFVMEAWGKSTGAEETGITMLADASGEFTKAMGMSFDAPPVGFYGRSKRYSMLVEGGEVQIMKIEEGRGVCETSAGETLLAEL